ncbi:hypothetical protein MuYL_4875 [Mucilaginibacter xinganensis]|uniref:Uncharacterized protein n=1 Tax=Mucilaginibacter xinganensis TaxID=1234841 RepID=A0A223P4J2_9SPHI|nr:hypothetical protein MuYL_4875 [Mucilaginibacter xinganensis]
MPLTLALSEIIKIKKAIAPNQHGALSISPAAQVNDIVSHRFSK